MFAWLRKSGGSPRVAVVSNFTPAPRQDYLLPLPRAGEWRERINTDAEDYGGSGQGNLGAIVASPQPVHGQPASASILLPPLATLILHRIVRKLVIAGPRPGYPFGSRERSARGWPCQARP